MGRHSLYQEGQVTTATRCERVSRIAVFLTDEILLDYWTRLTTPSASKRPCHRRTAPTTTAVTMAAAPAAYPAVRNILRRSATSSASIRASSIKRNLSQHMHTRNHTTITLTHSHNTSIIHNTNTTHTQTRTPTPTQHWWRQRHACHHQHTPVNEQPVAYAMLGRHAPATIKCDTDTTILPYLRRSRNNAIC